MGLVISTRWNNVFKFLLSEWSEYEQVEIILNVYRYMYQFEFMAEMAYPTFTRVTWIWIITVLLHVQCEEAVKRILLLANSAVAVREIYVHVYGLHGTYVFDKVFGLSLLEPLF